MKIKSFYVVNYRSIINSKECFLSPNDGITILAGQNESGKSSLLEALKHYESNIPLLDAYRDEENLDKPPHVFCTYTIEEKENLYNKLNTSSDIDPKLKELLSINDLREYIKGLKEVTLHRAIGYSKELLYGVGIYLDEKLSKIFENIKLDDKYKDLEEATFIGLLGKPIFLLTPQIIYFDEFDDILPELFYIEDLSNIGAKGRQAVKDIESLSGTKFSELTKLSDKGIQKWEVAFKENLSLNFNQKWQQRIIDGDNVIISAKYYQGREDNRPYLRFFIETREGETLPPAKRSLGFKWFLSFYLRINAENKKVSGALLVFDEPGSQLHLRAQHDMLKLFEDLSKTNQIIYSTHSPYLIDTNKLSRVRLVFNTKKNGTVVEKITTKISANQKDAMKPIIDALGMQVAHDFSAAKNNNVIVEGISDHYYLSAAKKLLGITDEFYFMPAMGASNAHILMELCIGWGLDWLMIFDDKGSATEVKKIKSKFFPYDTTTDKKIYTIKGCDGIEDIFEEADIKLAQPTFARTEAPLKEDLAKAGTKELIGRFFLDKALSGEITWDNLSKKAQDHLKSIFNFIADGFLFF